MKRLTALCIALILFITPVFSMQVFAEPEPRSMFDYTDDILEDGSLIYYFEELSLRMPADWRGKLTVVQHQSGVSFYQKASNDKYREEDIWTGGFLFQLGASVNQSFTYLPSFRYLGFSEQSAMNYYLRLPTDYPAYNDPEIRAEYDKMFSQIDYVVKNVELTRRMPGLPPAILILEPSTGSDASSAGKTAGGTDSSTGGTTGQDSKTESTGWKPSQVRYFFEHKMLPRYFYEKPEALLDGVRNVGIYPLWEAVSKENGTDPFYPKQDYSTHYYKAEDGTQIVQVEMPQPDEEPSATGSILSTILTRILPPTTRQSAAVSLRISALSAIGAGKGSTNSAEAEMSWIKRTANMPTRCWRRQNSSLFRSMSQES